MTPVRTLILGAAGRDFHNFNVVFRDDASHRVVAFTAQQIPHIENRRYPPELAGDRYPDGIPVLPEGELERLIEELKVDLCVLAYSDLSHEEVILWDGGNNDTPFLVADLTITVLDPHRAGDELRYHPGETSLRTADVVVVNKVETAGPEPVLAVLENVRSACPEAVVLEAASPVRADAPEAVGRGRACRHAPGPPPSAGGGSRWAS